jgi:hypothetical protein
MNRTRATVISAITWHCLVTAPVILGEAKNLDPSPDFIVAQADKINNLGRHAVASSSHP